MSTKPKAEDYPSAWSWWQARRVWLRGHGGRAWVTVLLAIVLGAWTGSVVLMVLLVLFAIVGTVYARSRP